MAIGIGVHNLGEGLAIGTSFAFGELQLGTFLIVGFMIHNVTEGLGDRRSGDRGPPRQLPPARSRLAVIAGAPGDPRRLDRRLRLQRRPRRALLRRAAGAALQVVVEVGRFVARRAPGGLRSGWVIGGYLAGIAAMYLTGLLVG